VQRDNRLTSSLCLGPEKKRSVRPPVPTRGGKKKTSKGWAKKKPKKEKNVGSSALQVPGREREGPQGPRSGRETPLQKGGKEKKKKRGAVAGIFLPRGGKKGKKKKTACKKERTKSIKGRPKGSA